MKNGSHSRHTTPYDKGSITVKIAHQCSGHPLQKQTMKKLQKKKARKHNKILAGEQE